MDTMVEILRMCRVTSKYKGYFYLPDAIELALQLEEEPFRITKDIYPQLARRYQVTPYAIEGGIRTVVEKCWLSNRELVKHILGYDLHKCPTNTELIDAMVYYLSKQACN